MKNTVIIYTLLPYIKPLITVYTGILLFLLISSCSDTMEDCEYIIPEEIESGCSAGMDVAFLLDYTGSMGGAINSVKSEVDDIVNSIVTQSNGDYRLALSVFDETIKADGTYPGPSYIDAPAYTGLPAAQKVVITSGPSTDQYLTMMEKFAPANSSSFSAQLDKLNNSSGMLIGYGVNGPEPGGLLLNEILNNDFAGTWRSGNITKLAIIITDAPAGGDDDNADATDDTYLQDLAADANAMGVQCVLLTTFKGSPWYGPNYKLQLIANNTGGLAYEYDSFDDISQELIRIIENICD
ncbi:vWA domain-containing protein [Sinomicrobium soli]|uniref:hypothetical protein n=1 Tax=Sinomicrobium sp. N-1-3-6 TaxID=2219864 RepID=UPI000DCC828E|nr:hypothetical protein [Sinomicrobium sp. N-1-3-6]RAV29911.1 hypothetical protein DN748_07380 [Sinomicrobium sp. N-1-3-6]